MKREILVSAWDGDSLSALLECTTSSNTGGQPYEKCFGQQVREK